MNRPAGRTLRCAALALSTLLLAPVACGLPDDERTRTVDAESVPYNLLEPNVTGGEASTADPALPRLVPVVFWLRQDGKLTPAPVNASCDESPADVVESLLRALAESPTLEQRRAGWESAIPASATLQLSAIDDGIARVDIDPVALGDPERLPRAVGQLVLSVASAPGVDALQLVTSGDVVEVPLPGGGLVARPVTADDYVQFLPRRLAAGTGTPDSSDLGCRAQGQ